MFIDATLATGGASEEFLVVGNCDVWILGLTSGSVSIQVKFPYSSTWTDMPGGTYTEDVVKTLFLSEHGVKFRLQGVGNNSGVYVRLARFLN